MKFPYLSDLEQRFLRYVQVDTVSDESSETVPSTNQQLDLLRMLKSELEDLGASDVVLTDYGTLIATIPSNSTNDHIPTIAFFSHVDTAPAYDGSNVKPRVHRNYDGSPITFPDAKNLVLDPSTNAYLGEKTGEDIITASGKTLLGADDKAGVAIMMTMAKTLLEHFSGEHGTIRLVFTPDEEIGTGVRHIHLEDVAADYAYTLDGQDAGEITYETFSADKAVVSIAGVSAHPGYAQGILVNAITLAVKLIEFLPQHTRTPETTSGREGYIHPYQISGNAAYAEIQFILRDFEREGLSDLGDMLNSACEALALSEPRASVDCSIAPQYRNMRYWLESEMLPVELAIEAIREQGIEPIIRPIRGGTDGSQLTERGLLTPNLFTGMQNLHGPLEWISLQDMHRSLSVCLTLVSKWTERSD